MNTNDMTPEVASDIANVQTLMRRNREITRAGGFFTSEQINNERIAWKIIQRLRHEHGIEPETYQFVK